MQSLSVRDVFANGEEVGCFGSIPFDSFERLILLIPWTDSWTDSFDSGLSIQKLIKIDAGDMDLRTEILEKVTLPKSIVIIQKCEWKFVISSFAILLPS